MRKRYKNKKRSCSLCKPWKKNITKRFKARELQNYELFEKKLQDNDGW